MSQHVQVVCILLFGLAILYVVFGTTILYDMRSLKSAREVPLWYGLIAVVGLACTVFAIHFLVFGNLQMPRAATPIALTVVLGSAIIRRIRAR